MILGLVVGLLVVGLDQWTKALIERGLGPAAPVHVYPVIGDVFRLEYGQNTGAAFGLLRQHPLAVFTLALIILVGFGAWLWRQPTARTMNMICLGLIGGGAVGNLIDRIRLGYVTDFIAIGIWPNFNLADSAICVGVVLVLWASMRSSKQSNTVREGSELHV